MQQTTDEASAVDLLNAIASGDNRSLDTFYHQFETSVYRFAMSRLGDSYAAADVLTDVMMQVWKKAGTFDGRSKVNTWLLGITHHKIIDYIRKESRHHHDELDHQIEGSYEEDIESNLSTSAMTENMEQCVEDLKENQKEAVYLTLYADLSYQDIAAVVGCPEGTVKSRMFHARKALKKCLEILSGR